jgi:hypothetical protein
MNRRDFVKMSPAFAGAAISASLVVREDGKETLELGVSVLKVQSGDVLVLTVDDYLSYESTRRLEEMVAPLFAPGVKILLLQRGMTLDGVLRQG